MENEVKNLPSPLTKAEKKMGMDDLRRSVNRLKIRGLLPNRSKAGMIKKDIGLIMKKEAAKPKAWKEVASLVRAATSRSRYKNPKFRAPGSPASVKRPDWISKAIDTARKMTKQSGVNMNKEAEDFIVQGFLEELTKLSEDSKLRKAKSFARNMLKRDKPGGEKVEPKDVKKMMKNMGD